MNIKFDLTKLIVNGDGTSNFHLIKSQFLRAVGGANCKHLLTDSHPLTPPVQPDLRGDPETYQNKMILWQHETNRFEKELASSAQLFNILHLSLGDHNYSLLHSFESTHNLKDAWESVQARFDPQDTRLIASTLRKAIFTNSDTPSTIYLTDLLANFCRNVPDHISLV